MFEVTLSSLQDELKKLELEPQLQEETQQVLVLFKEGEREFPVFFRIFDQGDLLQMIAFFPFQLPDNTIGEMARLLHLLNKELDVPGFGMDEMSKVSFFRVMINIPEKKLSRKLFETFVNTMHLVTKTFSPTLEAVAAGGAKVDQLLQKAQDAAKKIKKEK